MSFEQVLAVAFGVVGAAVAIYGLALVAVVVVGSYRTYKRLEGRPHVSIRENTDLTELTDEQVEDELLWLSYKLYGSNWRIKTFFGSATFALTSALIVGFMWGVYMVLGGGGVVLIVATEEPLSDLGMALLIGTIFALGSLGVTWWDKSLDVESFKEERHETADTARWRTTMVASIERLERDHERREAMKRRNPDNGS